MTAMQAGTQMVKLRGGSKGLMRFYFLDEHRSCIRWRPSRKNEKAKSEWTTRRGRGTSRAALVSQGAPGRVHGFSWPWSSTVTSGWRGVQVSCPLGPRPCCPPGRARWASEETEQPQHPATCHVLALEAEGPSV